MLCVVPEGDVLVELVAGLDRLRHRLVGPVAVQDRRGAARYAGVVAGPDVAGG